MEEALCDRLACRIHSKNTQKRLLFEVDLTLKRAVETALGMEAAEKTTKSLKEETTSIQLVSTSQMQRAPYHQYRKTT